MHFIYRLPDSNEVKHIHSIGKGEKLFNITSFSRDKDLTFSVSENSNSSENRWKQVLPKQLSYSSENSLQNESQELYEDKIKNVIHFIQENNLSKLVIARKIILDFDYQKFDAEKTFNRLCLDFPNALVYLFYDEETIWLGATPEILGKYNKGTQTFETMSLAGTLPIDEEWSPKEIEEHEPVKVFIKVILEKYNPIVEIGKTYSHGSGKFKHLRTDFRTYIKPEEVNPLIQELHPTPAVCGIPKELCRTAILDFEKFDRKYYSGYFTIEDDDFIYYFVNLRCAEIYENAIILYAGGGITQESNPKKEWEETQLKSEVIKNRLSYF